MTLNQLTQMITNTWPLEFSEDQIVVKHSIKDEKYMPFRRWREAMKALNQDNRQYPNDSVTFCIKHNNECTTIVNFHFIKT